MNKELLVFCVLFSLASCSEAAEQSAPVPQFEAVPGAPGAEAQQIDRIVDDTTKLLQNRYGDSLARRGVHPKDHGCVKATVVVNPDIPDRLRVGVFSQPGKSYDAWVRFSNATGVVTTDYDVNRAAAGAPERRAASRGMAIKLMGVDGTTLFDEPGAKTQDFLLINQPMFGFGNVSTYLKVTELQLQHKDNNKLVFGTLFGLIPNPSIAPLSKEESEKTQTILAIIGRDTMSNPLDGRYFSASPFLYGPAKAAKFSVTPRNPERQPLADVPADNVLREAMKKSLDPKDGKPAVFDFQVQLRPDGLEPNDPAFPIEDAATAWKEPKDATSPARDEAAFEKVAVLTIQPQDFDNPLRATECEHLVFTPWHGLVEHRPLGGINRLRRAVYIASSHRRAQAMEPSKFPTEYPR